MQKAREAQPGRAELWRCLGCKFKSYLEHLKCVVIVLYYGLKDNKKR